MFPIPNDKQQALIINEFAKRQKIGILAIGSFFFSALGLAFLSGYSTLLNFVIFAFVFVSLGLCIYSYFTFKCPNCHYALRQYTWEDKPNNLSQSGLNFLIDHCNVCCVSLTQSHLDYKRHVNQVIYPKSDNL